GTATSSSCSNICGRATSSNCTVRRPTSSRGCLHSSVRLQPDESPKEVRMLLFKWVLFTGGLGLFAAAVAVLDVDASRAWVIAQPLAPRWRMASRLAAIGCLPLLLALSIAVVPSGMAGVRVSQFSGTQAGTLYPGTHLVLPLVHRVELYSIRDQIYTTVAADSPAKVEVLKGYSREGLALGLGVTVRFQLDPTRLPYVESHLPQPVEHEVLPGVVANAFRQTVSGYLVRDVFSTRREEVRRSVADEITRRLGADGILVKEVMLRDIALPPEYAKGLEGMLLVAQENDRM